MGVGQLRISKLENANNDRTLDSVVAYLTAAGAEMLLAVRQDGFVHQASQDCWLVDVSYQQQKVDLQHKRSYYELEEVLEVTPVPNILLEAA